VLRELEAPEQIDDHDAGAALAYLEAMWSEATIRAHATDAAHGQLHSAGADLGRPLCSAAGRYHAAVRVLREIVAARIAQLVKPGVDGANASERSGTLGTSASLDLHGGADHARAANGCAPRAA
jgi:hypothetical protein